MKQYMPMKPIKRGFKIWASADSDSGFLLNLEIYTGKKSNGIPDIPLIFKHLCDGIFSCGTFRVNKKYYPKHFMKTDVKYTSGDIEYAQSEDIGIMRWKDRESKPVTLISNMQTLQIHLQY
ncbi:uncharacterized protein LOC103311811 [Acyrthosiphon pisum]|uniref:PiggyBac transposable element-derived protein domain-containing protein n=1 Tax=Acyrthosiphon pisum TaxID=7029 RepID=A0A8R2FF32_ACYPI|nr:uncharacterized protein LOC103311811 [Acyrthosiphon pisum]|eukprot:XP_008189763.1 PREDICTED: uncharacterized protein LOC103311811 [Acyrthosiphon pisum]